MLLLTSQGEAKLPLLLLLLLSIIYLTIIYEPKLFQVSSWLSLYFGFPPLPLSYLLSCIFVDSTK